MTTLNDGSATRLSLKGLRVARAAASLPQSTAAAIFTIAGGRVIITSLVGEVTTVIQTQANNTKLIANPAGAGTSVDMCAVLDISADEVGCLYGITGVPGDALIGANAGLTPDMLKGQVLNVGTIDLSCAASNTGAIKWVLTYVPLDDGATVVAA